MEAASKCEIPRTNNKGDVSHWKSTLFDTEAGTKVKFCETRPKGVLVP